MATPPFKDQEPFDGKDKTGIICLQKNMFL